MRVVITGGSGLIGRALTAALLADGHAVTVLTRDPARAQSRAPTGAQVVGWNLQPGGAWESALDGADAVVNLAGESISAWPWTAGRKRRIRDSRVDATRAIAAALAQPGRPRVLVNGSAVGYYGDAGDRPLPESAPPGADFLAAVVVEWEREARAAEAHGVRVALARAGVVLAAEGGALAPIAVPFKFFLGGVMGRPEQWFPWIHLADEVGLLRLAIDTADLSGPINLVGPEPVTMATFSRTIGRVLNRPTWLPGAALGMKIVLGEQSTVVLSSAKVIPEVAQRLGYQYAYPTHEAALRAALRQEAATLPETAQRP
jgi:uncharacterized protein (TIGR01777 family)